MWRGKLQKHSLQLPKYEPSQLNATRGSRVTKLPSSSLALALPLSLSLSFRNNSQLAADRARTSMSMSPTDRRHPRPAVVCRALSSTVVFASRATGRAAPWVTCRARTAGPPDLASRAVRVQKSKASKGHAPGPGGIKGPRSWRFFSKKPRAPTARRVARSPCYSQGREFASELRVAFAAHSRERGARSEGQKPERKKESQRKQPTAEHTAAS